MCILSAWQSDDLLTATASLASSRGNRYPASSEIPRPASSASSGREKTVCGACGKASRSFYDRKTRRVRDLSSGDTRVYLEFEARRVDCKDCGGVKRERINFLAGNPFYTKRFGHYIGERCQSSTIKDVAQEFKLDWHTVKDLEKEYMTALLAKARTPAPMMIGVDEVSIRKGHTYRIVVSDLVRRNPIWFGGTDRSIESMDTFYEWLGPKKCRKIRLAVMDMWKPFAISLRKEDHAPGAAILFDKFHVMRHLGDALDAVRRSEYHRLSGKDRSFIKGQRYTLLSNHENLTKEGRESLKKLLAANKRLNTAYLLKESFDRLWTYKSEVWMRKFFDNWKNSLKWQRLGPFEKFAAMVERNWDGLATYCCLEDKPSLGFVEGLNTKIRVIQRRAYGLRDEEYLRLKILTSMLLRSKG
jgi:transposase